MGMLRRIRNPGKRERLAGKRYRRASVWCSNWGAETSPLKRGSRHFMRGFRRYLAVVDSRKLPNSVKERGRQHLAGESPAPHLKIEPRREG